MAKFTDFFIGLDSSTPCWIVIDRPTGKRLYSSFKRSDSEQWVKNQILLWEGY